MLDDLLISDAKNEYRMVKEVGPGGHCIDLYISSEGCSCPTALEGGRFLEAWIYNKTEKAIEITKYSLGKIREELVEARETFIYKRLHFRLVDGTPNRSRR